MIRKMTYNDDDDYDDGDLDHSLLCLSVCNFNGYHPLRLIQAKVQKGLNHLQISILIDFQMIIFS